MPLLLLSLALWLLTQQVPLTLAAVTAQKIWKMKVRRWMTVHASAVEGAGCSLVHVIASL
jgi:hypothetical protein